MEKEHEAAALTRMDWVLWASNLGGPLAWFAQLNVNYSLVPTACESGSKLPLHLVSIVALAIALGAAAMARRELKRLPPAGDDHVGAASSRLRFMSISGIVLGLGFSLLILASEIPNVLLRSCD